MKAFKISPMPIKQACGFLSFCALWFNGRALSEISKAEYDKVYSLYFRREKTTNAQ